VSWHPAIGDYRQQLLRIAVIAAMFAAAATLLGLHQQRTGLPSERWYQLARQQVMEADLAWRLADALEQFDQATRPGGTVADEMRDRAVAGWERRTLMRRPSHAAALRLGVTYGHRGYSEQAAEMLVLAASLDEAGSDYYTALAEVYSRSDVTDRSLREKALVIEAHKGWLSDLALTDLYRRIDAEDLLADVTARRHTTGARFAGGLAGLMAVTGVLFLIGVTKLAAIVFRWGLRRPKALAPTPFIVPWRLLDVVEAVAVLLFVMVAGGLITQLSLQKALAADRWPLGQPILMGYWSEAMGRVGITSAQVLLTQDDVVSRGRCMRLRETMEDLLSWRVLPVLNENDSVSTESVTFGENDLMAAMVAVAVTPAELLVILSDQEGLFTADPREHADARLISEVQPNEDVSRFATGAGGPESLGGMEKKLEAAKRATDCGIRVVIAGGDLPGVLTRIVAGEPVGTCMLAGPRLPSRKAWLAVHLMPQGTLIVDDGARRALLHADGASLLPSGIMTAEGHFHAGDLVVVLDRDGQEIARGLTNYSAEETRAIMGAHSSRIPELIGREGAAEVIHRDDMVVNAPHGT